MKRGHVILIAGAALLVAGISITAVSGASFAKMFMSDNTFVERSLNPGESVEVTRNVEALDRPLSVAIGIDARQQPQSTDIRLQQTITDPSGRVVSTNEFDQSFATTVTPEELGVYKLSITNIGAEPVALGGAFGHLPFLKADGQPDVDALLSSGGIGAIIAGGGLAIAGIITLIAGGIITVMDSRRGQGKTSSSTTEGGITYKKD